MATYTDEQLRRIVEAVEHVHDELEKLIKYGDHSPHRLQLLCDLQSSLRRAVIESGIPQEVLDRHRASRRPAIR